MAYATEFQGTFFKSISFSVDEKSLVLDDTEMMCEEVTGFGYSRIPVFGLYGAVVHYNYAFVFRDYSGDKIEFWFSKMKNLDLQAKDAYETIVKEVWASFGKRLLQNTVNAIAAGEAVVIAGTTIDRNGFHFTHYPMIGDAKKETVSWHEIEFSTDEERLYVESPYDKNFSARWDYCKCDQARLVERMLLMTYQHPPFIKTLTGNDQTNKS